MHVQFLCELADGAPFGQTGPDGFIVFLEAAALDGTAAGTTQADAGAALGRQGLARALGYKVALNLGREGEGEGYDLGIQGLRKLEVVLDGTDLNTLLGTGV